MERVTAGIDDLMSRMLQIELFVVTSTPNAGIDSMKRYLREHILYMIELERAGVLFASGPTLGPDGSIDGSGLTVLRCRTLSEARDIACADPLVRHNLRHVEVRKWIVNEGSISISVRMSEATGSVA